MIFEVSRFQYSVQNLTNNFEKMIVEKGMEPVAKLMPQWEPKSITNRQIPEKWHAEIDAKICYFSKGATNRKQSVQGAPLS